MYPHKKHHKAQVENKTSAEKVLKIIKRKTEIYSKHTANAGNVVRLCKGCTLNLSISLRLKRQNYYKKLMGTQVREVRL